jgi:predicted RNase H-like HicB family nuclease
LSDPVARRLSMPTEAPVRDFLMQTTAKSSVFTFHLSERQENGNYVGWCDEFAELTAEGETEDETLKQLVTALTAWKEVKADPAPYHAKYEEPRKPGTFRRR